MTHATRDERDIAPYDWTLAGGPEGQALAVDTTPLDPGRAQSDQEVTYYTREQSGPGPEDVQWTPLIDPAEIAAIEGALAQGIDPPYEVWVDQAPAARGLGALTPDVDGSTAYYAWEQTGPQPGDGQFYEVTDPVVIAAYAEAHPEPHGVEITNPVDYDEAAATPDPAPDLAPGAALDRDLTPALDV